MDSRFSLIPSEGFSHFLLALPLFPGEGLRVLGPQLPAIRSFQAGSSHRALTVHLPGLIGTGVALLIAGTPGRSSNF